MTKQQRADHVKCRLDELYQETPIPLDHKDPYTSGSTRSRPRFSPAPTILTT
jgi:hypothetical protein